MDAIKNFLNLMSIKQMESQILAMRPFLTPNLKAKIKKDKFLLFSYEKHFPRFRSYNEEFLIRQHFSCKLVE